MRLRTFSAPLSYLFEVQAEVFFFALFFAVTSMLYQLTTNSLRVFFKMKAYALLTAVQSVVLLAAFLTFIGNDMTSWESASYSYYLSYAVIGFILIIYLRDYIKPRFDRSWARKIMHYAVLALPGAVAGGFMGVDRILINKFHDDRRRGNLLRVFSAIDHGRCHALDHYQCGIFSLCIKEQRQVGHFA